MTRSRSVGSTPQSPVIETSQRIGGDNDAVTTAAAVQQCEGHEHFDIPVVDELISMTVDDLFNRIFNDATFYAEFTRRRHTTDVQLAPWPKEADDNGQKTRIMHYNLNVNFGFGMKCCPTTETQVLHAESRVGCGYVVDADCINVSVPYGDHFNTVVRYCLKRVTANLTQLCVTGKVRYHKSVWTFMKSLIQKSAANGLTQNFGVMVELLHEVAAAALNKPATASGHHGRPCTLAVNSRRSRTRLTSSVASSSCRQRASRCAAPAVNTQSSPAASPRDSGLCTATSSSAARCQQSGSPHQFFLCPVSYDKRAEAELWRSSWSVDSDAGLLHLLVVLLLIIILSLVVINALLYYQLAALESTVASRLGFDTSITRTT